MTDKEFLTRQVHILALALDYAIEALKITGAPSSITANLQKIVMKVRANVVAN